MVDHKFKVGDWILDKSLGLTTYDNYKAPVQITYINEDSFRYKHNVSRDGLLNRISNRYRFDKNTRLTTRPSNLPENYKDVVPIIKKIELW